MAKAGRLIITNYNSQKHHRSTCFWTKSVHETRFAGNNGKLIVYYNSKPNLGTNVVLPSNMDQGTVSRQQRSHAISIELGRDNWIKRSTSLIFINDKNCYKLGATSQNATVGLPL